MPIQKVPLWIFGPISIVTMKQNTQWCGLGYKHFWGGGHYLGGGGEMEQQLNVMSSPLVLALYDIRDISFERLYITNWTVKVRYDEISLQIL